MKNLAKIYALSEFIPEISQILQYGNEATIAKEISKIAEKITETDETIKTINILKDPEKLELFKKELLKFAINLKQIPNKSQTNTTLIIIIITLSLLACLLFITIGKENFTEKSLPILSTISGIFGSCLKDIFSSIFGTKC